MRDIIDDANYKRIDELKRELAEMRDFRESETRWAAQYKRERDRAEQSAARLSVELGRALSDRDGLRYQLKRGEETAARMLEVTIQERDEARECLRESITAHVEGYGWSEKDVQRWSKAAGMEGKQ